MTNPVSRPYMPNWLFRRCEVQAATFYPFHHPSDSNRGPFGGGRRSPLSTLARPIYGKLRPWTSQSAAHPAACGWRPCALKLQGSRELEQSWYFPVTLLRVWLLYGLHSQRSDRSVLVAALLGGCVSRRADLLLPQYAASVIA